MRPEWHIETKYLTFVLTRAPLMRWLVVVIYKCLWTYWKKWCVYVD